MSLILEALRKSEAERRLGSAPELLTAMPVLRMPAPRAHWPLAMTAALALVAALGLGWWLMRSATTPPAIPVAVRSSQEASAADAAVNAAIIDHRNAQPSPRDAGTPRIAPINAPPFSSIPRIAAPNRRIAVAAAPPITPSTALSKLVIEPVPFNAAPGATAPSPAPAMPTPPASVAEPALLSLADLSTDERNGLPALKVSMHVYADDPARRFMIVDGQRVGEGTRLADGVILVRIRRDGAELDAHGRRLLLPKP
jgi:general secretion pathway protein B